MTIPGTLKFGYFLKIILLFHTTRAVYAVAKIVLQREILFRRIQMICFWSRRSMKRLEPRLSAQVARCYLRKMFSICRNSVHANFMLKTYSAKKQLIKWRMNSSKNMYMSAIEFYINYSCLYLVSLYKSSYDLSNRRKFKYVII